MSKFAGILPVLVVSLFAAQLWTGPAKAQQGPPLNGEFERFIVHPTPQPSSLATPFVARDGSPMRIGDFAGRYVLVNFWAPGCEGSRYEVPTLNSLQEIIGSERLAVVLIASDTGGWVPIDLFRNALEIRAAEIFLDNELKVLAESGLTETRMGSVLYDPNGMEIGRIDAWADWDAPEAIALIDYFVGR